MRRVSYGMFYGDGSRPQTGRWAAVCLLGGYLQLAPQLAAWAFPVITDWPWTDERKGEDASPRGPPPPRCRLPSRGYGGDPTHGGKALGESVWEASEMRDPYRSAMVKL